MSDWQEVCRFAGGLPDARLGEAHEGSPAWYVGRHPFARLRWDDSGRQILQYWSLELDSELALGDVYNVGGETETPIVEPSTQ